MISTPASRRSLRVFTRILGLTLLSFVGLHAHDSTDKKWSYGGGGFIFSTPEQACQAFVDKEHAPGYKTKIKPTFHADGSPKPEIKECWYLDKNDNNKETYYSIVYEVDVPTPAPGNDNESTTSTDPCEETAPGPYSTLTDPPGVGKGKPFTPEQKRQVFAENRRKNGMLKPDDPFDPCYEQGLVEPPTGRGLANVYPKPTKNPCEAQVDHHIPRLDKQGKPCGRNSYNNARVTSFSANNRKSNNMSGGKDNKPPLKP